MVSVVYSSSEKTSKDKLNYSDWLAALAPTRSEAEIERLRHACEFAEQLYSGATRASGESYLQHALAAANILASLKLDVDTLVATLLHEVVEAGTVELPRIAAEFGAEVASLVDGVTKMGAIEALQGVAADHTRDRVHTESLRKMFLAMAEDVRVVLIKLADRVHNMRTLGALPAERQRQIARETMDIFAPLANRLGIWQLKWELEDLAFRYLEPDTYKKIAKLLKERRVDREQYIQSFINTLEAALHKVSLQASVTGRPKHIYSIYRKMARKDVDYTQIYDIRAVRVLVNEVRDCYAVLGIVHSTWQYIPGEFDDYIANPKANQYRSLHTAIIGPGGKTVEVQIRTHDMHQHSELGVAAHWRYKEGREPSGDALERRVAWLRQVLEWKEQVRDASDFVDKVKADIFEDRIYVFTPQGHVVDLPQGSTPLDFAYHIHTDLGHRCRGAKVNGRMVPLTYALQTAEQVQILAVKRGEPSRDWLNPHLGYLHSPRARAKVQHWFKQQNLDTTIQQGRDMLERELHRLNFRDANLERLSRQFHFTSTNEFLAALGRADLKVAQVVSALQHSAVAPLQAPEVMPLPVKKRTPEATSADVRVRGVGNLLTQFALCCKPVPGDDIKGYITRGRGVTVHRADCSNILRHVVHSPERMIEVEWGTDAGKTYPVTVLVTAYDRQGLLRDISSVLANENVNVTAVSTFTNPRTHIARLSLTLEIPSIEKLSLVLAKINQVPNVQAVQRETQG
jgi:GTP pyrophosphokinase